MSLCRSKARRFRHPLQRSFFSSPIAKAAMNPTNLEEKRRQSDFPDDVLPPDPAPMSTVPLPVRSIGGHAILLRRAGIRPVEARSDLRLDQYAQESAS
jgi:hypothetical protein